MKRLEQFLEWGGIKKRDYLFGSLRDRSHPQYFSLASPAL